MAQADPVLGEYLRPAYRHIKDKIGNELSGVLIGAYNGVSANYAYCGLGMKMFYLIDPYQEYGDGGYRQSVWDDAYSSLCSTFAGKNNTEIIRDKAENVCNRFADLSLDFVYIDGDHSYEHVLLDSEMWFPKVRHGGVMAGHDYELVRRSPNGYYEDVSRAVGEFCVKHSLYLNVEQCPISHIGDWWVDKA